MVFRKIVKFYEAANKSSLFLTRPSAPTIPIHFLHRALGGEVVMAISYMERSEVWGRGRSGHSTLGGRGNLIHGGVSPSAAIIHVEILVTSVPLSMVVIGPSLLY
jgi:hypothetical protein